MDQEKAIRNAIDELQEDLEYHCEELQFHAREAEDTRKRLVNLKEKLGENE